MEKLSRYKSFLPENLQEIYEAGLEDTRLLHLREEINLLDLRIKLLLENIDAEVLEEEDISEELEEKFPKIDEETRGELAHYIRSMQPEGFIDNRTFKRLEQKTEQYENAMERRELRKADAALRELFRSVRTGRRVGEIWDDIQSALDQRRRLVDQEQSRLTQQAQLLTVEKVVLLLELTIESLRLSVNKYVSDEEIRDYILVEAERNYNELIGGDSGGATYQIEMDQQ